MDKVRRIDFYFDDWIAGTAGLNLGADGLGVYFQSIAFCYALGRPSIPEAELVDRSCATSGSNPRTVRAAIERLVAVSKLKRIDGELEPNRVRTELERAATRIRKNRENGTKGGRRSNKSDSYETHMVSDEKPYQSSVINHQPTNNQLTTTSSAGAGGVVVRLDGTKPSDPPTVDQHNLDLIDRVAQAAGADISKSPAWGGLGKLVRMWLDQAVAPDTILEAAKAARARREAQGLPMAPTPHFLKPFVEEHHTRACLSIPDFLVRKPNGQRPANAPLDVDGPEATQRRRRGILEGFKRDGIDLSDGGA